MHVNYDAILLRDVCHEPLGLTVRAALHTYSHTPSDPSKVENDLERERLHLCVSGVR